ncbi:hypothetical protein NL676_027078 [Syzygium grande]|nr:hypothetical protein NL676_027078 [Syzygium grande]
MLLRDEALLTALESYSTSGSFFVPHAGFTFSKLQNINPEVFWLSVNPRGVSCLLYDLNWEVLNEKLEQLLGMSRVEDDDDCRVGQIGNYRVVLQESVGRKTRLEAELLARINQESITRVLYAS